MKTEYDVIVCGGGPSGFNACISAARNGMKTILIEATGLVGGNSVNALVGPWMTYHKDEKYVVKGIAQELITRLQNEQLTLGHIKDPLGFCDTVTPIDVEGIKHLFFEMLEEDNVDVLLHSLVTDCIMENNVIKGVKVTTKSGIMDIRGKVIIDATGDGDVSAFAKAEYVHGRSKDNLTQPMTMIFHVANVDIEVLKQEIKKNPENFVLREGYDYQYLAVSGFFKEVEEAKKNQDFDLPRDRVLLFEEVNPNTVSINMTRVQGLSGANALDLTKAEIEARKQIKKAFVFLKKYIPGFEKSYIVRTPSKIGVRETRHIIGDYVIDVDDIINCSHYEDSIALSGFPMDIHSPSGDSLELFDENKELAYEIPLRSLLVKNIENLIVSGRCISATHEASASLRVTPSVMAIGEAAGVLASLSVKNRITPRKVKYQEVQEQLAKQGQIYQR
ncbi:MAG: FAD-dependent oxidoreductase [Candidatus Izemoplasmatales bacterium]|nr:FAD-dependent oxidoreductase [Candidatus Izemoplasmatales bacterium]